MGLEAGGRQPFEVGVDREILDPVHSGVGPQGLYELELGLLVLGLFQVDPAKSVAD